jgi:hypothetical protein
MFKIKIDCTNYIEPKKPHNNSKPLKSNNNSKPLKSNNQLYYKNQIIKKETKFDFDFNSIDIIEKCYVLYRTIINTNSKFTYKSLEFEINKKLDINELRQFIIMLQNLGFKSSKKRNTTVQFIDITENNKHIYYKPIHYNKIENENEELEEPEEQHPKKYKKQSKYNQIELYTKKTI